MLQLQKFYGDNLQRAGYGYTSFGLDLLSDTQVNIITIRGTKGNASYPYDGGGGVVLDEVRQYFTQNLHKRKVIITSLLCLLIIQIPIILADHRFMD